MDSLTRSRRRRQSPEVTVQMPFKSFELSWNGVDIMDLFIDRNF